MEFIKESKQEIKKEKDLKVNIYYVYRMYNILYVNILYIA